MNTTYNNVDEYIQRFPENIQILLDKLRKAITKSAPEAKEVISYGMPAYKFFGMLVYFAAHKNHIGFYPTASAIAKFKNELSDYKNSKGTVQFPLDKPLPTALVSKIVTFRVRENLEKAALKKKK
jgi:uncharacterized protein YdhG (YjbR/CyaY superfamily)